MVQISPEQLFFPVSIEKEMLRFVVVPCFDFCLTVPMFHVEPVLHQDVSLMSYYMQQRGNTTVVQHYNNFMSKSKQTSNAQNLKVK